MTAPLSFAVQAAPARDHDRWIDLARRSEDLGYRALLVPDHMASGGPLTATAIAGAVTRTLRVGPLMLWVDLQDPVALIRELATLEAIIGDRLEVGLGAGWMRSDFEAAGRRMAPGAERIDHLRRFTAELRERWGDFDAPRPHAAAPRLVMGGGGPRMLALAAAVADIVSLSASMWAGSVDVPLRRSASLDAFHERLAAIAGVLDARQTRPELQCLVYDTAITTDPGPVVEALSARHGLSPAALRATPLALVGDVDEVCAKILTLRDELGISYWVVKAPVLESFAPVVDRLAGR